jgi:hypothetical protein
VLTADHTHDGGRASLSFDVGQLFACPVSVELAHSVALNPCARLDLGRVVAEGTDVANPRTEKLFWASAGPIGQLVLVPVKPLVIGLEASVLFPLTPYKFIFSPDSVVYEAPRVGFSASLGVGVMFL